MKKLYHYSFYFLFSFVKALNKQNDAPAFSGAALLSVLMSLNVLTVVFIKAKYSALRVNPYILSMIVCIPLFALNYYFLIKNNKRDTLINSYKIKWKTNKADKLYLAIFLIYLIISVFLCGYIAYLIRHHKM
jgi:hypothetical protein